MFKEIIIGVAALAFIKNRKKNSSREEPTRKRKRNGISGFDKRRIFREIAAAQEYGIDLDQNYNSDQAEVLEQLSKKSCNWKPSSRSITSPTQQYFNSLQRMYKSISGVGRTDLPYEECSIMNNEGDLIMIYRDYGQEREKLQNAIEEINELPLNSADRAALKTLAYIADGKKLIWKNKRAKDGQLLKRGVADILHGSSREHRKRSGYTGKEEDGAISLDALAEQIMWNHSGGVDFYNSTDYPEFIIEGVENAVLTCETVKQAQQEVLNWYYNMHRLEEEPKVLQEEIDEDIPF